LGLGLALQACVLPPPPAPVTPASFGEPNGPATRTRLIPLPRTLVEHAEQLELSPMSRIVAEGEALPVAEALAEVLRASTGFPLPIVTAPAAAGDVELRLDSASAQSDEGYVFDVTDRVSIVALRPAGLFYGAQTLRQLLPPEVEAKSAQSGVPWRVQRVHIEDSPRYPWRGVALDVARHFFPVADVKRLILLAAYHKLNRFHLHLTDDQGWRIEIRSWPKLASVGGRSAVGGGAGGFYTQQEFAELVAFADAHFITLVPEIDMPGHVQAALASHGELNPDGVPLAPYTGTDVGFSSLSFDDPDTPRFVEDVLREVAALTTGPYLHVGGDEARATRPEHYRAFMKMVGGVVGKLGKTAVGWCEAGDTELPASTLLQYWHDGCVATSFGARKGMKVIASPVKHAYLDMKYSPDTPRGQTWGGFVELQAAYEWQPRVFGVPDDAIVGIESTLWTEQIETRAQADYLIFPRLSGHAELGWFGSVRNFAEYRRRLAYHGKRLTALGVDFYRSPQVSWER
jgi:hexosaminidase